MWASLRRGARLVGTVRDAAGAPVANASVRVLSGQVSMLTTKGGLNTTTDDNGAFQVSGLSVGRNVVAASRDGFTQEISMQEMFGSIAKSPREVKEGWWGEEDEPGQEENRPSTPSRSGEERRYRDRPRSR